MQNGSDGCNRVCSHGEEQKQDKKSNKCARRAYFAMHAHNAKPQEMCRDGHGGQRGSFGEIEGEEEARGTVWMGIGKEGAKKRTMVPKKTKTIKRKFV